MTPNTFPSSHLQIPLPWEAGFHFEILKDTNIQSTAGWESPLKGKLYKPFKGWKEWNVSRNGGKEVSLSWDRLLGLELFWLLCDFKLFLSQMLLFPKSDIKMCHFHNLLVLLNLPRYFQMIQFTRTGLMYIVLWIEMNSNLIKIVSNRNICHNTWALALSLNWE